MSHKKFVNTIVCSLKCHPEKWQYNGYELKLINPNIIIWVANESYGLNVSYKGQRVLGKDICIHPVFSSWRRKIYRAVKVIVKSKVDQVLLSIADEINNPIEKTVYKSVKKVNKQKRKK